MTLIEIVVVITILSMLTAAVAVYAIRIRDHAQLEVARTDLRNLTQALDTYRLQKGRYPSDAEGLRALVEAHVVQHTPRDPWGNLYVYRWSADAPVVLTYGRDGAPGGTDLDADLSSAQLDADD